MTGYAISFLLKKGNPEILHQPATLDQISVEIGRMLFSFMLLPEKDLDTSMALTAIGVDSLVSYLK